MSNVEKLFLAWQDPNSSSWFPIGQLTFDGIMYKFVYTQGARVAENTCHFKPLFSFPQLEKVYTSTSLFAVFSNRLMSPSRPDYADFLQWLNISQAEATPLVILSRSGGQRETDNYTVFPCPKPDAAGQYHLHFFAHGLQYLPQFAIQRINHLQLAEKLCFHRFQNPDDSQTLTIRTDDNYIIGDCPGYLRNEFFKLIICDSSSITLKVERVNLPPTPLQFRLLCHMICLFKNDFHPFSSSEYQPLIEEDANTVAFSLLNG